MKFRSPVAIALAVGALLLTACTNAGPGAGEAGPSDAPAVSRTWAEIEESGVLKVGTIVDYPPNEFKTPEGEPTGWAVDLVAEIADELGLEVEWTVLTFDAILPRIQGGTIDIGVGSFSDTKERQQVVDFVNYFEAGSLWAAQSGSSIDPENACGLKVAVMATGTQHLDELPARNQACLDAGKPGIEIQPYTGQPEVTNAVVMGKADAFSADSPVTVDAVTQLDGQISVVAEPFDRIVHGLPLPRGGGPGPRAREALQRLIDDGRYLEILKSGNSQQGAIETATINAATE